MKTQILASHDCLAHVKAPAAKTDSSVDVLPPKAEVVQELPVWEEVPSGPSQTVATQNDSALNPIGFIALVVFVLLFGLYLRMKKRTKADGDIT